MNINTREALSSDNVGRVSVLLMRIVTLCRAENTYLGVFNSSLKVNTIRKQSVFHLFFLKLLK